MICELCTYDVVRGTMYFAKRPNGGSPYQVCEDCRDLIANGTPHVVNEPMCACGKMQEWICKASINAPCKPLDEAGKA